METRAIQDHRGEADGVVLTPFSTDHLAGALALSRALAWPYRLEDWAFALRLGQGFVLERGGEVVGTAAWFPYGEAHATAGLIIVSGSEQGRGYGARLMDALLASAGPRTILLNSTPEGQALYGRRGFSPVGTIHQHQGIVRDPQGPPSGIVRPMEPTDFEAVSGLDRQATGLDRRPLLRNLLEVGDGYVLPRDGAPAGYAVSRLFGRGHVVGPVVADTAADARSLVQAAIARLEGQLVRIDTAAIAELSPWFEGIGLPKVSDALTMVRGTLPSTGPARVFALSNQSLN